MSRRLRLQSVQLANTGRDSGGADADAIMLWASWDSLGGRGITGASFCPFDLSLRLGSYFAISIKALSDKRNFLLLPKLPNKTQKKGRQY